MKCAKKRIYEYTLATESAAILKRLLAYSRKRTTENGTIPALQLREALAEIDIEKAELFAAQFLFNYSPQ